MNLALRIEQIGTKITFRHIAVTILVLKSILLVSFGYLIFNEFSNGTLAFTNDFYFFMVVGFVAQMIDGALGMAYGVSCTTLLMNFGIPANLASASVHASEVFTTGVSGLSHIKFKNIDKKLFFQIVITGVIGAVTGAYLVSGLLNGDFLKPYIAIYLLFLGIYIIYKGFSKKNKEKKPVKRAPLLALVGGFMDAIGGGGWGPIVTSNLLSQGKNPRQAIGTVNTAEFFVTFFATSVFITFLGVDHWQIIAGLVAGGIIAAPAGAYIASRINKKALFLGVGILIILTSSYTIIKAFL